MAKKIGILTYHYSNNYGAVSQAYALSNTLKKQGHKVEIINLVPRFSLSQRIKNKIKDSFAKNFKTFRAENFSLYPEKPFFYNEIKTIDFSLFDTIIVGSDQVWRREYTVGLGNSYFLDFVPEDVKKISYAASFGKDVYELNDKKEVSKLLKTFDLITVREDSGVHICKNEFNVNAHLVVDPVLLADKKIFFNLFKPLKTKTPFIAKYLLDSQEEKVNFIDQFAKNNQLEIKNIYKPNSSKVSLTEILFDRKNQTFPTVASWLQGIHDAEYIITDSFHGVAMSIVFNKQFICIYNEKRGKTRMENLLNLFDLKANGVSASELGDISKVPKIDYSKVNDILTSLQDEALNLLLNKI